MTVNSNTSSRNDTSAAEATSKAVSGLSSGFMLDPATYKLGAEIGFSGLDFYFAGRAGVLGDVCADVVASATVFFAPDQVRSAWDNSRTVMSRAEASTAFQGCLSRWSEGHLDENVDWPRLAELAGTIADAATVAAAPLFAAWRTQEAPEAPRALALARMNVLRELRMARHGAAVVALGIDPSDAVRHRTPQMLGIFGWDGSDVPAGVAQTWVEAERLTNVATARDYSVLTDDQSKEFVVLCDAALAAVR